MTAFGIRQVLYNVGMDTNQEKNKRWRPWQFRISTILSIMLERSSPPPHVRPTRLLGNGSLHPSQSSHTMMRQELQ